MKTVNTFKIITAAALSAAMLCLSGCAIKIGNIGPGVTYPNADRYTAGDREITEQIHTLEIDWPSGAVTVSANSGNTVSIKETTNAQLSDAQKVHSWVDGDILHVQFCKSGTNYQKTEPKTVEITVPESVQLESLRVGVASADVDCSGLSAKNANLDASSGHLYFIGKADAFSGSASSGEIHFTGESGEIQTTTSSGKIEISQNGQTGLIKASASAGDIRIEGEQIDQIKASTSSGKKDIKLQAVPKDMNLSSSSGDVLLSLPEKADFTATISTASGAVNFDLPLSKTEGDTYVCGNGTNKISVTTSSGSVTIQKN